MSSILDFRSTPNLSEPLPHLSDEQIDDLLMGDLPPVPAAHLAICTRCADRVADATDLMTSFQSVTMAWSERRSATLHPPDLSLHKHLWQRRSAWVTACVGFAVGLAVVNAPHRSADPRPAQIQSAQQAALQLPSLTDVSDVSEATDATPNPPPAQVSADNQMLQAIDDELHPAPNSPAVLGLAPVNDSSNWPAATTSIQD